MLQEKIKKMPNGRKRSFLMKTLGNILWFLFGGFLLWLEWSIAGLLLCITIIGIPAGKQCFKMAKLSAAPFGKELDYTAAGAGSVLLDVLWVLIFGWEIAVTAAVNGVLWCITIVGIPFGKQFFKIAKLALTPFGARVE